MALALVPRARGRREKIAKSGKKITTFDPILEGTRRVFPVIRQLFKLTSNRGPRAFSQWSGNLSGKKPGGLLNRIHRASSIDPAAAARDPIRLGHGPRGKGRFD